MLTSRNSLWWDLEILGTIDGLAIALRPVVHAKADSSAVRSSDRSHLTNRRQQLQVLAVTSDLGKENLASFTLSPSPYESSGAIAAEVDH